MSQPIREIVNFGRNLRFVPSHSYQPADEREVLAILERHRGESIRVVGSLHAWSELVKTDGVLLDLNRLRQVSVETVDGESWATVGAGCSVQRLLRELRKQGDLTTPSVGLITSQKIAGAISTGTHGSGKHSLSHYMEVIRVATYDEYGRAVIREFDAGDELRAARCSLGALGVILSVRFRCRRAYRVEEHTRRYETLQDVLKQEAAFPLQQFFLMPWLWKYYGQHRREVAAKRSRLWLLYRIYWLMGIDIGLHLMLLTLVRILRSARAIQFFFAQLMPLLVIQNWKAVDDAEQILVMEHELFRHIEIEIFVTTKNLPAALDFVKDVICVYGGQSEQVSEQTRDVLQRQNQWAELISQAGTYCHHYPICIRRILPDDTLLSMASGNETYYSISLISYQQPRDRTAFLRFAQFLASTTAALFSARAHWGKVCPHNAAEIEALYPRVADFKRLAEQYDSQGYFRNEFVDEKLAWTATASPPASSASSP